MVRPGDTQPFSPPLDFAPPTADPSLSQSAGDGPTTELSSLIGQPRRRSRWVQFKRWLISLLIMAMLAPLLLGLSLLAAVYWQARTDETRPVDAIVVMGTAQYNGRPSPVLQARLDRVLAVWEDDVAPLVVVTGGRQEGDAYTEAEASHDYLVEHGIPDSAILREDEGQDSWQSLQGVATLLEDRGLDRILIVSDGFHLLRSKKMAHDLGLTVFVTAAPDSPIRPGGANEFSYMVREVGGIVVYVLESWF